MKALFFSAAVVVLSSLSFAANAATNRGEEQPKLNVLGVLSPMTRADYEAKIPDFFKGQLVGCVKCEVRNLTPYNDKGEVEWKMIPSVLEKNANQVSVLILTWNDVLSDKNREVFDALKAWTAKGLVLVGPAGEPMGEGPSHALSRTMLGQVPDAVIIGDLNEWESLPKRSFYGPEMLTAFKPPRDMIGQGQGMAANIFAARLTKEWNRKSSSDWVSHFRARKSMSKRIWPGMDELFR